MFWFKINKNLILSKYTKTSISYQNSQLKAIYTTIYNFDLGVILW